MAKKKKKNCSFKDYVAGKCSHRGSKRGGLYWFGYNYSPNLSGSSESSGGESSGGDGGGVGESFTVPMRYGKVTGFKRLGKPGYEEDQEADASKKDQARALYQALRQQGVSRGEMIDRFEKQVGLSSSSASAYYERIAKEFGDTQRDVEDESGMTAVQGGQDTGNIMGGGPDDMDMAGMDDEPEPELQDWEDPNRQGVIRRVNNAHLVYKRQSSDGTFEELWVYKDDKLGKDTMKARRDILAGTDIPVEKSKSPDGKQRADFWASGNMQMLQVTGLPN